MLLNFKMIKNYAYKILNELAIKWEVSGKLKICL